MFLRHYLQLNRPSHVGGFYHYRYVMLDSVDGTYGGPTSDGKNGTGMVGMVMRGVRTCIRMSAEANQWFHV